MEQNGAEIENRLRVDRPWRDRLTVIWLLILTLTFIGALVATLWWSRSHSNLVRAQKRQEIKAIADLKAQQIAAWLAERFQDARFVRNRLSMAGTAPAPSRSPITPPPPSLAIISHNGRYEQIFLITAQGAPLWSLPPEAPIDTGPLTPALSRASRSGAIELADLYARADGSIRMALVAPIAASDRGDGLGGVPLFAVLVIDPSADLIHRIQRWPVPSETAEILLVRREAGEVVFLNELRHRSGAALRLRLPLSSPDLPAAMAFGNHPPVVEGKDYRNAPVLAGLASIPDTTWKLVAKMDQREAYREIGIVNGWAWLAQGLLTLSFFLGLGWILRQGRLAAERRAEEARRRQDSWTRRLDFLSRYANDIILLFDDTFRILEANDRAVQAYGYTRDELLERKYTDLCPAGAPPRADRMQPSSGAGGALFENEHRRRDGSVFPVECSLTPMRLEDRDLYQAIVRDITERRLMEDLFRLRLRLTEYALSHSLEEFLQYLLDAITPIVSSPIGFIHFVDEDQQTLSLQAWSTRTLAEFCPAPGRGMHYNAEEAGVWVDALRERRPVIHNDCRSLPHRKGLPEGHAELIRELVVPVFRGDRIVALLGVRNKAEEYTPRDVDLVKDLADMAWEISGRMRAEAALRENEERLRLSLDAAHLGTFDWDVPGDRIAWSHWHETLWGFAPGEFPGTYEGFTRRLHPDDVSRLNAELARCRADREPYRCEFRVVWPDGSVHWIAGTGQFVYDDGGRAVRMRGAVMEITDRKRAEEQISSQLNELQRWHLTMLGREGRVLELKREVNTLLRRLGEPIRYPSLEKDADRE